MSIRTLLKLSVVALMVFAAAIGIRCSFFGNVMPIAPDQDPQSLWALGAAFLLRSVENIAAVVAALSLIGAAALSLKRWRAA
jgi:hypothetical protein